MTFRFAVVACSDCRRPWCVELRHATVTCARCGRTYDLKERKKFWEGDDARMARGAILGLTAKGEMWT